MNKEKLFNTERLVEQILLDFPRARKDDDYLYAQVLDAYYERTGINLLIMSTGAWLDERRKLGIPSYDSVSRARRKVQRNCPELKDADVEQARAEQTETYIEWARE